MHFEFNRLGVKGFVFGTVAGVSAHGLAELSEVPLAASWVSVGIVSGGFASAVFGLLNDRCDEPGLWRSYYVNFQQFIYEHTGRPHPKYGRNSQRQWAFFGFPLAAYPLVIWFMTASTWIWLYFDNLKPDAVEFTECLTSASISIFLTWIVARGTCDRRLTDPFVVELSRVDPQHILEVQSFLDGKSASPGLRRWFAVTLLIGLLVSLLAVSGLCDVADAVLLALLGPIVIALSLGGLIDPRLNWGLSPGGFACPRKLRVFAITMAAVGVSGGVALMALVLLR